MRLTRTITLSIIIISIWLSCKKETKWNLDRIQPRVETKQVSDVKAKSVFASAEILHNGGLKILRSGFCVSKIEDSCNLNTGLIYDCFSTNQKAEGAGPFSTLIEGLDENVKYYIRAFAINEIGTSYGKTLSFSTKQLPLVLTDTAIDIKQLTAICSGNVIDDNGYEVFERGICWDTDSSVNIDKSKKIIIGKGLGSYNDTITSFPPETTIFYRAYALNSGGISYGKIKLFTTLKLSKPTINTQEPSNLGSDNARCGGIIIHDGGSPIISRGLCYSKSPNPTVTNSMISYVGSGLGSFVVDLTGLQFVTTYYIRAFASNSIGVSYGDEKTFTTTAALPTVITKVASNLSYNSFTTGGDVISDGFATVTDRGVCWGKNPAPTISDSKINNGSGLGTYNISVTGLSPNTKYYYRAYATNIAGTEYDVGYSVTTLALQAPKIVQTTGANSITTKSASSGGSTITDGGSPITSKGVCWNTSGNPKITDSKTNDGTGTANFTSAIATLLPETTYYVAAYATNAVSTGYGNVITFTTLSAKPTVSSSAISAVTRNSFTAGGAVTYEGGSTVTSKGICWSTNPGPTITNSKTNDGTGLGSFTSTATGLSASTKYYYRAYAVNTDGGIGYGIENSITTNAASAPTITTVSPNNIGTTTASSGGITINDGGSTITSKGVCWNTTGSPTIANSKTNNGTGTANFTSSLTGLTTGVAYYVRAYATNSIGTGYGTTYTFTPSLTAPTLNSPINNTTIGTYFYLKWSCITGATSYELQISTSSSFTGTLRSLPISPGGWFYTTGYHSGTQGTTCSGGLVTSDMMQTTTTAGPGTYIFYWRVRAKTSTTTGPWSSTGSFKFVK
jgi:hypothetical protein